MKKKFLALVLTLAMVLSLVPATALATDGTPTPDNDTESVTASQDGVNITKKVVPDGEGNYNLVMEAYVEGSTTTTTSTKPLDIVLVLDVSGSMDDPMGNGDSTKRIDALKLAVNTFIDNVAKKNTSTDGTAVDHKISIVKFAGDKTAKVGYDTYRDGRYTYNYSQIVENLTTVDATGKEKLTAAVDSLKPAGATRADYGMELAQSVLPSSDGESNRDKVVVMFTDGSPNSSNKFEYGVASSAIANSATLKGNNVKVYTVGIFSDADSREITAKDWNTEWNVSDSNRNNKYMQAVSSNYPTASLTYGLVKHSWNPGQRAEGNYYLTATNSTELNNVFKTISNSITTAQVTADEDAVLRDTLTDQFVFNGTNASAITVQKAKVTSKTGNTYSWGSPENVDGITKDISSDRKTVTVTGFDYTSTGTTGNVITKNGNDYSGYKLIVTIPIKPDTAYTHWKKDSNLYPTNNTSDNKAGLSNYKDKNGEALLPTLLTESPEAEVTAYTVTYNWGENAPSGQKLPTDSRNYIPGQSYTVDDTFNKDTKIENDSGSYQFSGWTDLNNGVMGMNDVTITGSWKHTEPTQPDPTYTLTYDANGGKTDSVPTGSNAYTAGQTVNLDYSKAPTHEQKDGKNVIFIGWSETNDDGKIYDKGDTIPALIQSVTMNDNKTVYAVWGLDKDGNNTPDVFEATVTYKIEHGYWFDAGTDGPVSTAPVTAQFTLYEKSGNQWVAKNPTLGETIPTGRGGDAGYTANGWYKDNETTSVSIDAHTLVTGDVTYTFKYVKTSTEATWDVSRSKTAASGLTKNSNGDWTTDVTLSLPSAEEELASDVVFVLDTSDCVGTVMDQVSGLVTQLKAAQESSGAEIKVGVVAFKGSALPMFGEELVSVKKAEETLTKMIDEVKAVPLKDGKPDKAAQEQAVMKYLDADTNFIYKGSNLHSGLLGAQELLKKDTAVSNTRKYVVTITDGMTYYWNKGDDVYGVYGGSNADNTAEANLLFYTWCGVHGIDTEGIYKLPETFSWDTYVTSATALIAADNGAYNVNIREAAQKLNTDFNTVRFIAYNADLTAQSIPYISYNDRVNHAHGIDQSVIACLATYQEMVDSKYKCYVVNSDYDTSTFPGLFTSELNKLANVTGNVDFTSIQKDILYAVSAGSIVTDTIGEKFTFGGVNSVTLTVGGNKITGTVDGNTVNFGEKKSDGKYPYTVTYTPDTKTFVWTINENVSNFAPVQLTYTVKLTKPETAAATYGQTDLDGDTFIDGTQTKVDTGKALYTNQSATLLPVNSAGKLGQPLLFPKPSVFYTINGSSGGHGGNGGGTVTIPDDVPTGLNGKDHYAYVVGYPDGMVYPQKNITRAEVATIFFRLLTDETREANMTKSNSYNDMKEGAWYTCAVSTLSKMGIIKGYEDGSFKPDASISRAEFAAIAARFDPDGDKTPATFSDVSSHWAKDEISIAANHGWIKGYEDGSFKPDQKITRAETMTLVNRVLKRLPETKDDLHKDMKTWPDNQKESAWFYLAVQEATNSHYQKLKKDGIHETWESMRETRDWAALEK